MRSPTQLLIHGQWWSIRRIHRWQMRQWCARGGRYVSHRVHTVQFTKSQPESEECMSEKSIRLWGNGTVPGSVRTARTCAIISKKTTVLNVTTLKAPINWK